MLYNILLGFIIAVLAIYILQLFTKEGFIDLGNPFNIGFKITEGSQDIHMEEMFKCTPIPSNKRVVLDPEYINTYTVNYFEDEQCSKHINVNDINDEKQIYYSIDMIPAEIDDDMVSPIMDQDMPQDMDQDMPQDMDQDMPQDMYQDMPQDMYQDMPQDMDQDMPPQDMDM